MTADDQIREEFLSFDGLHEKCAALSDAFVTFCDTHQRYFDACVFNDDGTRVDAEVELPNGTSQGAAPKNVSQEEDDCSESEADDTKQTEDGEEPKPKVLSVRHRQFWQGANTTNDFFKSSGNTYKTPCSG